MNENKKYTAADFARYHAGTMPAAEMHALEKAALEDPFLEDALEGYSLTASPSSDAADLRERISDAVSAKKVFFLSPKAGWWRIAALLLIMVGAGYLFFTVNNKVNKENTLAKNEKVTQVNSGTDSGSPVSNFTVQDTSVNKKLVLNGNVSAATTVTPLNINIPPQGSNAWTNTQANTSTYDYSTNVPQAESSAPVASSPVNVADGYTQNTQRNYYQNTQSNNALNNNAQNNGRNNSAAFNYIYNNTPAKDQNGISTAPPNLGTVSDDKARFKLNVADSIVFAKNTLPEYKAKKAGSYDDELTRRKSDSDAVVVSAPGIKKQAKEISAATSTVTAAETAIIPSKKTLEKISEVELSGRTSIPSSGQTPAEKAAFDKYIKENIQVVYDRAGTRLAGEVLLSFTVKKGRPKNIKVAMSLCPPCEAQAIHLLENGPDWSGKKNEEKTVIIKF